jgi:hypothetical protein
MLRHRRIGGATDEATMPRGIPGSGPRAAKAKRKPAKTRMSAKAGMKRTARPKKKAKAKRGR